MRTSPRGPSRRRPGRRGPRAARASLIAIQAAVLAAAAFALLAPGLVPDRARALVASWQLFPGISLLLRAAVDAAFGGAAAIAGLAIPALILSAVFGRWYCAALCPLGTLQGIAARASRAERRYRKPRNLARAAAASLAVALSVAGATAAASWLDPWSLFGRFAAYDVRPLAQIAARADAHGAGFWTAAPAAAAIAAILALSALSRTRWFCGTLCPVGSVLGLLNKFAPFRVRLDPLSCVKCGACAARCPASCIDASTASLDATRCVGCLACVDPCPTRALYYGRPRAAVEGAPASTAASAAAPAAMSRSSFLALLGGGAAALALAAIPGRAAAKRLAAAPAVAVPPGARSAERFVESCTACGLCVSACPSSVLLPSLGELGPRALLAPRLDFSVSYCQYECVSCSAVCPSGALSRMPLEAKKLVKIGTASLVSEHCIVFTERTKCGACAEHCPTGAVHMVEGSTGLPEPVFESSICVGCGACHHICPVPGKRAISVAGLAVHETASKPPEGKARPGEAAGGASDGGDQSGDAGAFPF
jgi:ferredoxin